MSRRTALGAPGRRRREGPDRGRGLLPRAALHVPPGLPAQGRPRGRAHDPRAVSPARRARSPARHTACPRGHPARPPGLRRRLPAARRHHPHRRDRRVRPRPDPVLAELAAGLHERRALQDPAPAPDRRLGRGRGAPRRVLAAAGAPAYLGAIDRVQIDAYTDDEAIGVLRSGGRVQRLVDASPVLRGLSRERFVHHRAIFPPSCAPASPTRSPTSPDPKRQPHAAASSPAPAAPSAACTSSCACAPRCRSATCRPPSSSSSTTASATSRPAPAGSPPRSCARR
jgi:hypothetical protein